MLIMKTRFLTAVAALFCAGLACASAAGRKSRPVQWPEDHQVRISWDRSTYSEITEAEVPGLGYIERNLYYPRAKHLSDGAVLLSFSNHHYGFDIYAMRSIDGAKTWSDAVCIAHSRDTVYRDSGGRTAPDRIVYVNPDFIELQDGRIIMAFQWRFYKGYGDLPKTNENCGIMISFSSDKGRSWSEPVEVYRGRCWEPAFLQLPSGEIQMYITSSQDIREKTSFPRTVVIRSFDGGMTWQGKTCCGIGDNEVVSRTYDDRFAYDGMPSAVVLDGGEGIVVPLESWHGKYVVDQTPIVVKTTMEGNWHLDQEKVLSEGGPDYPMKKEVNRDFQGYGPYCTKLGTGEVIVQSNGYYKGVPGMWTFVGDRHADNFHFATSPFNGDEYWGSIDYMGGNTLISTGTCKYQDSDGEARGMVRMMCARLNYQMSLKPGSLKMVPVREFDRGAENGWWFLGKKWNSQMFANFAYSKDGLEFGAYVFDDSISAFSTENSDAPFFHFARPDGTVYGLVVNAKGKYVLYRSENWSWHKIDAGVTGDLEVSGTVNDDSDKDLGFSVKVRIPWDKIGGAPAKGEVIKVHLRRHYLGESKEKPVYQVEDLEGENSDYPSEWLGIKME